jgi:hypothetical protein
MIDIVTASVFVFSSIYGQGVAANVDQQSTPSQTPVISISAVENSEKTTILTANEIENEAKKFFKDEPLLVDIARCESHFRQFDEKGNPFRGKVNKGDIGVMQINEYYHGEKSQELGLNIKTVDGNLAYAKYLYKKEGAQPWISSAPCWKQAISANPANQVALR